MKKFEFSDRGKFKTIRGMDDSERELQKYQSNDTRILTQGDRLNEIKMNRQKLSRSTDSRQKNYGGYGLDGLKSPRKRK